MSENTTKETQILGEFQNLQSSYRLNGRNYLKWSQIVKTFLKGKGKINHLMDNPPSPEDPKFTLWDEEDSMIMSWLWNSIMPEVCGPYMFLVTAKDIWDAVRQTYSKVKDAALIYEIKTKLSMTKQGNMMVIEYYNTMKSFWLELDYYQDFKMQCSDDAVILKNYVERERIFEFLAGLNIEFDQMRVQILGKESLPSLNEVFSVIRAEEGRRTVMLDAPNTEGSAMLITNSRNMGDAMNGAEVGKTEGKKFPKEDLFCNYCKKTGHTKETCWKLHGKPPRMGRNGGYKWNQSRGHAHLTNSEETVRESSILEVGGFNKEEIERLKTLLNTMEKPSGSCSLAKNETLSEVEQMVGNSDKHITRVLFCGPYFPASHQYTKEYLQKYPFIQVDDVPLAVVPDVISNYNICIVKNMRLTSNIISRATRMKLIMQFGVGLEGVDIDAATKYGIKVARIPGDATGNAASCAEMAIYLMLGLLRKQNEMQISIKQKRLGEPAGETLLGKTVFIMGFGNIGIDLAKRLRPFGVKIIATKRNWALHSEGSLQSNGFLIENGTNDNLVDEKGSHEDIYKFAGESDIVVCCLRMNKETAGVVNKSFISSMKKGALLVNIARGGLLDYDAVVHHLESGHLGGLGIDVAWTEPFDPDDPILKFNNVIISPHVAGVTEHSYRSMSKVVGDVALQLHSGNPLTGIEIVN